VEELGPRRLRTGESLSLLTREYGKGKGGCTAKENGYVWWSVGGRRALLWFIYTPVFAISYLIDSVEEENERTCPLPTCARSYIFV